MGGERKVAGRPEKQLTGKAATQARILAAAAELFVAQGYEGTTIAEVASRAGVARATVFWHFNDKGGLFRETFSFVVEPFRASLERGLEHLVPEKRLLEQVATYQNMVGAHRETIAGFVRWAVESPATREWIVSSLLDLHQRFAGVLSETFSEIVGDDEDPSLLAAGLVSMLDGALILSLFDESRARNEERVAGAEAVAALISRKR